jgi:hypothetical protein
MADSSLIPRYHWQRALGPELAIVRYPHAPHVGLTRRPPSFARFCLTSKPHIRIKAQHG